MSSRKGKIEKLNQLIRRILEDWYERVREYYVTEEDGRELGVEPELKTFHSFGNHLIKFSRKSELDVTYGLAIEEDEGDLVIVASVNNKSEGFDYDGFVDRLKTNYWRMRNDKPWTRASIDHFAYGDLIDFEPRMGQSISLDIRKDKADIVRLHFRLEPEHETLLLQDEALLTDLIESYCLNPLKRIYAESYRE